jgi:L-iditol 2-dehydrogenase
MKRAKLIEACKIIIEENVPKPTLGIHEVLIRTSYCGICGSDIAAYLGEHPFIHPPIVLGHEACGIIEEINKANIEGINEGDKVIVEPLITCGTCYNCRSGNYNRCEKIKVIGCQTDGAFSEFFKIPYYRVYRLPDEIPLTVAPLIEPLAVAVHAVKRGRITQEDNVVVIGDGPVGLLTALVTRNKGAEVAVIGISDRKLNVAKNLGIQNVINGKRDDVYEKLKNIFDKTKIDVVIECVGHTPTTLDQAIELTRRGGRIVVVGVFHKEVPMKIGYVQDKELELYGSLVYVSSDFYHAIDIASQIAQKLKSLITKVFPLDKVDEAFQYLLKKRDETIKVMIKVG